MVDPTDDTYASIVDLPRLAFPAYRVFVYGIEVTNDVYEVRVNNSGGSAERSAGTCSFSFVNPNNKYTLTYRDMQLVGESAKAYSAFRKKDWAALGLGGQVPDEIMQISLAEQGVLDASKLTHEELSTLTLPEAVLTSEELQTLGRALKKEEEVVEHTQAVDTKYKEIADNISKTSFAQPYAATNLAGWSPSSFGDAGMVKESVLTEKLRFITEVTYEPDTNLNKLQDRTILEYPMQQGDCIFHPNDPVRVCFRDPFDPRIWYWQFTGFVDAWTENQGPDEDSLVSINCTDVTKMARYSYIQIGVGMQDPNIESVVTGLREQAKTQVQFVKDLFSNFTMLEVLETLFFGTSDARGALNDVILAELYKMTPEDVDAYLERTMKDALDPNKDAYIKEEAARREAVNAHLYTSRMNAMANMQLPPLSIPAPYMRGQPKGDATTEEYSEVVPAVVAKRKGDGWGVSAYFYGDIDAQDANFGEGLRSLKQWNDKIYHRVQKEDLRTMALDSSYYTQHVASIENIPPAMIMSSIGTNIKDFPVGHGRVFYLSRARFASGDFGRNIIDKALGGSGSLFSIFKDKLSFIYDMAERADFRFYATPRGDFVYEMPFYDFNLNDFTDESPSYPSFSEMNDLLSEDNDGIGYTEADLVAMGFYKDPKESSTITDWNADPTVDYEKVFTLDPDDQMGFTNTYTDRGIFTVFRCKPHTVTSNSNLDGNFRNFQYAVEKGGVPTLGVRVTDADSWGFIAEDEDAEAFAALTLARVNAEAKNASVPTLPKFGLMVNRPLHWRARNYYANVVSLQHSIVWNSSADTSITMNSLRGWGGEVDQKTGELVHRHFSGTDRPFSMASLTKQKNANSNTQGD